MSYLLAYGIFLTDRFPLSGVYRIIYKAIALGTALGVYLWIYPDVSAVYLRRSLVTGFFVPGLSDIDLLVVRRDPISQRQKRRLEQLLQSLARWLPILDPSLHPISMNEISTLGSKNPFWTFRLQEGRQTWRLLLGRDVSALFPIQTREALLLGHANELRLYLEHLEKVNWPLSGKYQSKKLEYLLFKSLVACFNSILFSDFGTEMFDRKQIVQWLTAHEKTLSNKLPCCRDFLEFIRFCDRYSLKKMFRDYSKGEFEDFATKAHDFILLTLLDLRARAVRPEATIEEAN